MQLRRCAVYALALLLSLDCVHTFVARFGLHTAHSMPCYALQSPSASRTQAESDSRMTSNSPLRLDVYIPRNVRNRSVPHHSSVRLEMVIDAASKGRISEAVQLYDRVAPSKDKATQLKQCNILLRALGDHKALSACDHVLQGFSRLGLQPNTVTFCTLISRAGIAKKPEAARRYFQSIKSHGMAPDVASFNALGSAFAKSGDTLAALNILPAILHAGLSPTIITFNTLLDACARCGDVKQAEHIFQQIASFPVQPTSYTYSSLAHAYAVARDPAGGAQVLRRMIQAGIEPGAVIYTTLIDAFGAAGKLKEALDLLEEMQARGLRPTLVTLSAVLTACARGGQLDVAFQLFRTLLPRSGGLPTQSANTITCTSLLACCLKRADATAAFSVLHEMCVHGVPLNEVTASVWLSGCVQLQQRMTHSLMTRLDYGQPDSPHPGPPLVVVSQDPSSSYALGSLLEAVDQVHRLGVAVDSTAYNVVILACAERGDLDQALRVLSVMRSRGIQPDTSTLRSLLLACRTSRGERMHALRVGEELYSQLHGSVLQADIMTYVCLLELHLAVDSAGVHKPRVSEISEEMRRRGFAHDPLAARVMRRLGAHEFCKI